MGGWKAEFTHGFSDRAEDVLLNNMVLSVRNADAPPQMSALSWTPFVSVFPYPLHFWGRRRDSLEMCRTGMLKCFQVLRQLARGTLGKLAGHCTYYISVKTIVYRI